MATKQHKHKPVKGETKAVRRSEREPQAARAGGQAERKRRAAAQPAEAEPQPAPAPEPAPVPAPVASAPTAPRKGRGKGPIDLSEALIGAWATHERIHHYLLEHLDPAVWDAPAPIGKGRTIRAIVAHLHNVRHMWLAVSSPQTPAPAKVDRDKLTLEEARAALRASGEALTQLLRDSLAAGGHVKDFKPDVAGFLAYAIAHEAHHRGQICMLARALGKPLPQQVGFGMWEWRKRHAETLPPPPAK